MATCNARGGDLDLISELPDSILHHILSFLDMIYVIQTCILSKRWRYIWASLPFLNFDLNTYNKWFKNQKKPFHFFVDHVLIFRDQNSNVQTFTVGEKFSFSYTNKDSNILGHIYTWIHLLSRNNVQVIDLHLDNSKLLPISLFKCKSLTTLKLDMGFGHHNFYIPDDSVVYLPALKTLHLKSLMLDSPIQKLILECPVLETLIFCDCRLSGYDKLTISNAQLKRLVIETLLVDDLDDEDNNEYRTLYLSAPNMKSFSSLDNLHYINRCYYSFVNVPSLENAEIDIECNSREHEWLQYWKEVGVNAVECLRGIYNVKSLMLSALLLELVTEVPDRCESMQVNPFSNLSLLQLKTSFSKHQICATTCFLEKCPNLETLILKVAKVKSDSVKEGESWKAESAPQFIMHHLKLVQIWDVLATANELQFLKFLLKNAAVLEKMVVFTTKQQFPENDKRFKSFGNKLISYCGASSNTEIVLM